MRYRALIRLWLLLALLVGVLASWPTPTAAANTCTLDTTTIDFGGYDPLRTTGIQAVGYVSYRCNYNAKNLRITLSAGNSGNAARRSLPRYGNGGSLQYLLTLDPTHTQIWGDGYGATVVYTQASVIPHALIRVPMYGWIPGKQITATGPFWDMITAQLSWN